MQGLWVLLDLQARQVGQARQALLDLEGRQALRMGRQGSAGLEGSLMGAQFDVSRGCSAADCSGA